MDEELVVGRIGKSIAEARVRQGTPATPSQEGAPGTKVGAEEESTGPNDLAGTTKQSKITIITNFDFVPLLREQLCRCNKVLALKFSIVVLVALSSVVVKED